MYIATLNSGDGQSGFYKQISGDSEEEVTDKMFIYLKARVGSPWMFMKDVTIKEVS